MLASAIKLSIHGDLSYTQQFLQQLLTFKSERVLCNAVIRGLCCALLAPPAACMRVLSRSKGEVATTDTVLARAPAKSGA